MMHLIQVMQVMTMRTTIDLPEAKHAQLKALAEKRSISLGRLIAELTDIALEGRGAAAPASTLAPSAQTGLMTLSVGRPISSAEVSALLESP
jgi:predicted DNA-binding ribbon-helix-helix protein